jgi:glycosyltransferase involved in cell wall biosynthesis
MIRAAKRLNVPLLVSLRGSDVPGFSGERLGIFGKVLPWFFRTATRAAALVVPNGRRLAELAAPHAGQAAVHVLPNGVDTDVFHPSASPRQDSVVRILFVGQFIARKRCRELLEALAALPDHGPAMEVGLAGGGPLEPELQSLAARAPERVRVRFLGLTDRDHMPDVYRNHDLLVQISRSEGVSNVVLEGLASGLAVLAAPEAVDGCLDGAGGIERLERFDPRTLGSVLDRLAGDRARLAALQSEARASSSQLGWGARIAEFERIASRAVSDFSRS